MHDADAFQVKIGRRSFLLRLSPFGADGVVQLEEGFCGVLSNWLSAGDVGEYMSKVSFLLVTSNDRSPRA